MTHQETVLERLSAFTNFSQDELRQTIALHKNKYKRYGKRKKSGGIRLILHPPKAIKALQYAIETTHLNRLPTHGIAKAYIHGLKSPLRVNAISHAAYKYTLRIDIKDFFPSIKPVDLFKKLQKEHTLTQECKSILRDILFYTPPNGRPFLPIGAPTSPIISNIVLLDLDSEIETLARGLDQESCITRYADDIYFSTNMKNLCNYFLKKFSFILKETTSPKLSINTEKTLFLSRGTKRKVTGLTITPTGAISIGHDRKNETKTLLYKNTQKKLTLQEYKRLCGLLAFIRDCTPDLYDRLAIKYGEAIFRML